MMKRGRPLETNARGQSFIFRMADDERKMLDDVSDKTKLSKSDVMRNALKMYYNTINRY